MLTLDKIYHASYTLKKVIRPTDLIYAPGIKSDGKIYLKTENLQVTGSFKVRGAYYKISQLTDAEKEKALLPARPETMPRVRLWPRLKMVLNP